jgi:hypothetical protein
MFAPWHAPDRPRQERRIPLPGLEREMTCSLSKVAGLISAAIAALVAAIVLAYLWVAALPLFAAAALVASVAFYFIPEIKKALLAYVACRGPSERCRINLTIDTLGQAAATLSVVSFAIAAVMQVAALAFLYSWLLSWLGVSTMAAVQLLVSAGQVACAVTAFLLLGVLTNAWSFAKCMDDQQAGDAVFEGREHGASS